jgi:hypothetical protein
MDHYLDTSDVFTFIFLILGMITQSDISKVEDPVRGKQVEMQTFISILSLFTVKQIPRHNLYVDALESLDSLIIPEKRDVDFSMPLGIALL